MVLNWGNGTLGSPVDGVSKVGGVEVGVVELGLELSLVSVQSLLLLLGHVSQEVDTASGGGLSGVALLDFGKGLLELSSSESELSGGSVRFAVLSNELDEFVVSGGHDLRLEELGSSWGLVVEGDDGEGSGGSESGDGGLGSHDRK